jgi:hypothetical protein
VPSTESNLPYVTKYQARIPSFYGPSSKRRYPIKGHSSYADRNGTKPNHSNLSIYGLDMFKPLSDITVSRNSDSFGNLCIPKRVWYWF